MADPRSNAISHLGVFIATFIYSLFTLAWIDRSGSGIVPMFSVLLVGLLVIASMLLFARLVERLNDLQINSVLHIIGDSGRAVIKTMFQPLKSRHQGPWGKRQPSRLPLVRGCKN